MDIQEILVVNRGMPRRTFIKGVIAAGATASSASYLFRGPAPLFAQALIRAKGLDAALAVHAVRARQTNSVHRGHRGQRGEFSFLVRRVGDRFAHQPHCVLQ